PVAGETGAASQSPVPAVQSPVAAAPLTTTPAAKPADVPRGTTPAPPLLEVVFETPRARVVATSHGAAIKSIQLLGDKWTRHKGGKEESHVDLVGEHAGEPFPYSTALKRADGAELFGASEPYDLVRQDATSATFRVE